MAVAVLDGNINRQHDGLKNVDGRHAARRRVFVQTDTGSVLGIELDRADNANTLKKKMQIALNVPTEESSLTFGDMVLKNDLSALRNDAPLRLTRGSFHRSSSTPCLSPTVDGQLQSDRSRLVEIVGGSNSSPEIKKLVKEVVKAVEHGVDPIPVRGGLGGAYFFRNRRCECIAIVKPTDEEPFAPNNPKGFVGKVLGQPGLKRSVRVGETGIREVAAYLLDHDNFAKVPLTVLVKITHSVFNVNEGMSRSKVRNERQTVSKIASFQQFVPHDFDASDHGTSSFPVAAVHRIGILDIRILNTDRHAGNLLVKSMERVGRYPQVGGESVELIPIDHGLCLPENLEDPYFEWLHWPQASIPFSEDELEYIYRLDANKDAEMLRAELPMVREACLRILILCTIFLKKAAESGLCLAEIGAMMTREFHGVEEGPSELEVICLQAKLEVDQEMSAIKSEEEDEVEDKFLNISSEEEIMGEQFQFDMDYEEDDNNTMNFAAHDCTKETYCNRVFKHESVEANGVNRSLYVPESNRVPCYLSPRSSSNSQRMDLHIRPVSNGTPRSCRGGKFPFGSICLSPKFPYGSNCPSPKFPFGSNCTSPRTPRGGCWSPLSKLEEISPLEENEMQEPVPLVNIGKHYNNHHGGPLSSELSTSLRTTSFSDRNQGCPRHAGCRKGRRKQGVSAAGAMQSGHEQGALTGNSLKFSDMTEEEWTLFIEYFQELLVDAFVTRKSRNTGQRQRLGTSCQF
uniref:1-phosphatidylinositol 4-kinase n=1 Tax=Wollemia nobilis TaxID=56998 RepID=A0A0C9QSX1_9CONI